MESAATAEVRERGEITIPKKIRELVHLEEGEALEFIPLGRQAVLLIPKPLGMEEARRKVRLILKQAGTSPEEVLKTILKELPSTRQEVFQRHYQKSHGKRR